MAGATRGRHDGRTTAADVHGEGRAVPVGPGARQNADVAAVSGGDEGVYRLLPPVVPRRL